MFQLACRADVTAVQVLGHYNLRVTFADGLTGDVDVSDLAALDGDLIRPLHDPGYFARVRVDPGLGTLVWPNGTDLAPERLQDEAAENPVRKPGGLNDQRENIHALVFVLMDNAATILKVVGRVLDRAGGYRQRVRPPLAHVLGSCGRRLPDCQH